jgi:hypothetical protein
LIITDNGSSIFSLFLSVSCVVVGIVGSTGVGVVGGIVGCSIGVGAGSTGSSGSVMDTDTGANCSGVIIRFIELSYPVEEETTFFIL